MKKDILRVMKKDSIIWHKIDCNDINAMFDSKITRYHYLKYNEFLWNIMCSEKLNNQNRLRQSDFLKFFKEIKYKPILILSTRPKDYKKQLKKININKKFKKYSINDLSITNFILLGGKGKYSKNIKTIQKINE